MNRRTGSVGLVVASIATLVMSASVLGYAGTVDGQLTLRAEGECESPVTLVANVVDAEGQPRAGVSVTFVVVSAPDAADGVAPSEVMTNADGEARAEAQLSNKPGERVYRASAEGLADAAGATVSISCAGEGLPRTDAAPASPPTPLPVLFGVFGGAVLALAFATRRFVAR